jgi:hypothetical protein
MAILRAAILDPTMLVSVVLQGTSAILLVSIPEPTTLVLVALPGTTATTTRKSHQVCLQTIPEGVNK